MTETPPRAARLATPRWLDVRLVLGIVLVLVAVVVGARVVAASDHDVAVYAAAHPLVPGERISDGDLSVVHVRLGSVASSYVAAGQAPIGYVVTRYVPSRDLLPASALATTSDTAAQLADVSVPVSPGHLPSQLVHGDLVDVYLTVKPATGATPPPPQLVASRLAVETVSGGSSFGGATTVTVVLGTPNAQVSELVHAVEAGTIDLVQVAATGSS